MKKFISTVIAIVMMLSLGVVCAYADTADSLVSDNFDALVVGGLTKVSISWDDIKDAKYYDVVIDSSEDYNDFSETVTDNSLDWAPDSYITPEMQFNLTVYAYDKNDTIIAKSNVVTFYVGVVMCDYWGYYGDVDDDNMVTVVDATYIQMYLARHHSFDYFKSKKADTDGDYGISILDATYIQLFCAEIYNGNSLIGHDLWAGAVDYEIMFEPMC